MVGMKSPNLWVMGAVLVLFVWLVGFSIDDALALSGSGTEEEPWRIRSLADFDEFAGDPNYWGWHTRLETDVNLAGRVYDRAVIAPDAYNASYWPYFDGISFGGVFDGNDHLVTGLNISGGNYLGLFGYVSQNSEIHDLGVEGATIAAEAKGGILVGHNEGIIDNCYSTGSVSVVIGGYSPASLCGGLVGYNGYGGSRAQITRCYSSANVIVAGGQSVRELGGLVGVNNGRIDSCYSAGSISVADVSSISYLGGFLGICSGMVTKCYSSADVSVTGDGYFIGGFGGYVGMLFDCYATGSVSIVAGDYAHIGDVGGLVGYGQVENCYSTGDVSITVGDNDSVRNVGGLTGGGPGGPPGSFWDIETSGMETSGSGVGKTTVEMKRQSTFDASADPWPGWDFINVWAIGENQTYPYLRTVPAGDINKDEEVNFLDLCVIAEQWCGRDMTDTGPGR